MHPDYSDALEKRKDWLRFAEQPENFSGQTTEALAAYRHALEYGETYVMNRKFCELVDLARKTVPDDLEFEISWMPTKSGWLYITSPFEIPDLTGADEVVGYSTHGLLKISAIGWHVLSQDHINYQNKLVDEVKYANLYLRRLQLGAVQFCFFLDYNTLVPRNGFSMWCHLIVNPKDRLNERIERFERLAKASDSKGTYVEGRSSMVLHEIRWIYTSLHLMSQRLATTVHKNATRGTRRRFERDKTPIIPEYRIVTLRRMEEDREKIPKDSQSIDWQWSWVCHGHWRNQWYPIEQEHKRIWIEEYIKGDLEKPLKPTKVLYRVAK